MKEITVRYLGGSGFLVSFEGCGFLFDASREGRDPRILPTAEELAGFDALYVFVSHHHEDHFDPVIYELCPEGTHFFLGEDIEGEAEGLRMHPGDKQEADGVRVTAYGSTDEGVSFLVRAKGLTLFHAGDLNLWHWRDESTVAEIEMAEKRFYACVEPIPREAIDLAFFPVDPRQGSMYDAGAGYFVMTVKPRVLIPMHFQGQTNAAHLFAVSSETAATRIPVLDGPGDTLELRLPEREPDGEEATE